MTEKEYKIKLIEKEIKEIYAKDVITKRDVQRANFLFQNWKTLKNWEEDYRDPIKHN